VLDLLPFEPARPDLLERTALFSVAFLVDVQDERPRRAFLVVAVAARDRDAEP
jgi:hypothetical protein